MTTVIMMTVMMNSLVHVSYLQPFFRCGFNSSRSIQGAIISKIKHAIKLETSPARLVQLLLPSLAFCFSLQPMTVHWTVRRHWLQLQAKTKC